ncbi:MAG TPA: hypothetical protein VF901_09755 [Bradyrhizobium sp.]
MLDGFVFFAIPKEWKMAGSMTGQSAAVAVKIVAAHIAANTERRIFRPVVVDRQTIQPQAQIATAIASFVIRPCAWSSTAISPPALASTTAGNVKGSTQHAVQAAATTAVATAAPAALPPPCSAFAAQAHPGDVSDGRLQDGPITLM